MKLVIRVFDQLYTYNPATGEFSGDDAYANTFNMLLMDTEPYSGYPLQRVVDYAESVNFTVVEYVPESEPDNAVY